MLKEITPLYSKILIKPRLEQQTTAAGIFVPNKENQRQQIADVQAVGEGYLTDYGSLKALIIKPGDVVIYEKFAGTTVKIENENYMIIDEKDVLAKIEEE